MRNKILKSKFLSLWLVIGVVGIIAISGIVVAYSGGSPNTVIEGDLVVNGDYIAGGEQGLGVAFGSSGTRFPSGISADSTSPSTGQIRGATLTATNSVGINGTSTATTVLDMLGTARVYPVGTATTTCDTGSVGGIMYSTGTARLMGCDGATWQSLW